MIEHNNEDIVRHEELLRQETERVRQLLEHHQIPLDKWGNGGAKTVQDLAKEVLAGEATLLVTPEGGLLRKLEPVGIDVYHEDSTGRYKLREEYAYFKDGRSKPIRERSIDTSLGEKMEEGEEIESAVRRGLREELGITGEVQLSNWRDKVSFRTSNTYPGLEGCYIAHEVDALISHADFRDEGYVERQKAKDIFFGWDLVAPPQIGE